MLNLLLLGDCPAFPLEDLQSQGWIIQLSQTPSQARRMVMESRFDLLGCQMEDFCWQQAVAEITQVFEVPALVLCSETLLDGLSYQYRQAPVLLLPLSASGVIVRQVFDYLKKSADSQHRLQALLEKEKRRRQDEMLISQAKVQLVERCRWSEEKAHHYIQKTAMDHSMTKAAAARRILRRLERIADEKQKNQRDASS